MRHLITTIGATLFVAGTCLADIPPDAVQWKLEDGGNGHFYKVATIGLVTWEEASLHAYSQGGHLATATSEAENNWIFDTLNLDDLGAYWHTPSGTGPALGGFWPASSTQWEWITGEPWDWHNLVTTKPPSDTTVHWGLGYSSWNNTWQAYPFDDPGSAVIYHKSLVIEWPCNGVDCLGLEPVQWSTSDGGNGHWYVVAPYGAADSWEEAEAYAVSLGGHLATLTSADENSFVTSLYAQIGDTGSCDSCGSGSAALLGGSHDIAGQWSWVTGEEWSFEDWYPGEPTGGGEDVLYLRCPGQWNDGSNALDTPCRYAPIIEWSADLNGNGIVDFGELTVEDSCPADVNDDGSVDVMDLLGIIDAWGTCP